MKNTNNQEILENLSKLYKIDTEISDLEKEIFDKKVRIKYLQGKKKDIEKHNYLISGTNTYKVDNQLSIID